MKDESALQAQIVEFLTYALPDGYRVECNLNNPRNAIDGAKLKRMGLSAGRPDIEIIGPGGSVAVIEIKTPKGRLSPAQKAYQEWCDDWLVPHCVARGVGDVQSFLIDLSIPIRARAA